METKKFNVKEIPTFEHVNSSNIIAVSYDVESKNLYIVFKQKTVYKYSNVSEDIHKQFIEAPSVGSFFYKNIKKQYPCEKVATIQSSYSKIVLKKIVLITEIDVDRDYLLMNNEKISIPLNE